MKLFLKIVAITLMFLSFTIGISIDLIQVKLPYQLLVFMAFCYFLIAIFIFIKLKDIK
jgi:hypothetical protein